MRPYLIGALAATVVLTLVFLALPKRPAPELGPAVKSEVVRPDPTRPQAPGPDQIQGAWERMRQVPSVVPGGSDWPAPPVRGETWAPDPLRQPAAGSTELEAPRFRPLSERERRRIESQSPRVTTPEWGAADGWGGAPSSMAPATGPLWSEPTLEPRGYSYRPIEPAERGRRWQGTDGQPDGRWSPEQTRPGDVQPQWGATPPDPLHPGWRMYPSLRPPADRTLTAND